jgi:hypothetical protein
VSFAPFGWCSGATSLSFAVNSVLFVVSDFSKTFFISTVPFHGEFIACEKLSFATGRRPFSTDI